MSRGIITLALPFTTAMLLSTGATAQPAGQQTPAQQQQAPRTQQQTPRTQQHGMQHDDVQMHTMRGCVAEDPSARGQVGASQMTGAEQTAILKNAAMASMAGQHGPASKAAKQANAHDMHKADGTAHGMHKADGKDAKAYRLVAPVEAPFQLAEFVGKQVEVRGTISPQPTPADEVKDTARTAQGDATTVDSPATDFEDNHKALTISTITKIADSCAADSNN